MGLEFNRSQVRDRGAPYAGLGESHGEVFLEIGDPDRRWGFSFGNQASTASGTRRGIGCRTLQWDLGLPLTAVAQGECGNHTPLHLLVGIAVWLKAF